jgi:uridine phosphorylase
MTKIIEEEIFPILEFDPDSKEIISPSMYNERLENAEYCVICFFKEVIEKVAQEHHAKKKAILKSETGENPIYEIIYKDKHVAFYHSYVGAPLAAGFMEEAIAHGYTKFVACGAAGVLDSNIKDGTIIIPSSAVRDEGTSYHYMKPSREIELSRYVVDKLSDNLIQQNIPYIIAKTWTTDAFYRETEKIRDKRRDEGCLTVEMECSAFAAVAKFRNVLFGQYLYGGDDIGGIEWDNRNWEKNNVRESLFWMSMNACIAL